MLELIIGALTLTPNDPSGHFWVATPLFELLVIKF